LAVTRECKSPAFTSQCVKKCKTLTYSVRRKCPFIPQSASQVHSPFQSQFSTQCDLMFPLSIYSILKVIQQPPTYFSSSSRHFYPSLYLPFSKMFQNAVPTQYMTHPPTSSFLILLYVRGLEL